MVAQKVVDDGMSYREAEVKLMKPAKRPVQKLYGYAV
jgi:hypothetical protein